MEDQINVREGDEERPSFVNRPEPDPPAERWAVLHPASECGLAYFHRMEALQRQGSFHPHPVPAQETYP